MQLIILVISTALVAPDDNTGGRYQATFAADGTTAEVVIPIVDDECFDGIEPEMFFADLSVPTAAMERGVAAGSAREATINVTDNDPAPVVNFASLTYEVMENAGSVTSMVVSSGPACKDYNITAGTRDASAVCKYLYPRPSLITSSVHMYVHIQIEELNFVDYCSHKLQLLTISQEEWLTSPYVQDPPVWNW